jgi:hypothetical protein
MTQYAQQCTKNDPIRFRGNLHTVDPNSSGNKTLCGLNVAGTGQWYIFHPLEVPTQKEATPCKKCKTPAK